MKNYNDYSPNTAGADDNADKNIISLDPLNTQRNRKGGRATSGQQKKTTGSDKVKPNNVKPQIEWFKAETYRKFANNTTLRLILGVLFGCLGVYLAASFVSYLSTCIIDQSAVDNTAVGKAVEVANTGGEGGARLSQILINNTFGLGSVVIVIWLFAMAFKMFDSRLKFKSVNFTIKCLVALIAMSLIVGLLTIGFDTPINWGGLHGREVNETVISFLGWTGAVILSIFSLSVFVIICLNDFIQWIIRLRKKASKRRAESAARRAAELEKKRMIEEMARREREDATKSGELETEENDEEDTPDNAVTFSPQEQNVSDIENQESLTYNLDSDLTDDEPKSGADSQGDSADGYDNTGSENSADKGNPMVVHKNHIAEVDDSTPGTDNADSHRIPYKFPPFDLLQNHGEIVEINEKEQLENQNKIISTLADFGIPIVSIEATVGPTVTLYEIVPENGIRITKIRSLVDDIALSLAARGVRIIAPIPGKGTVGIEVANKKPQTVSMRTVLKSNAFRNTRFKLPIALGSTIGGEVYIADLTKMPHLLVAGATGQGKSVGLNAIITSLLYCRRPDELKFVMVDPKMVEFSLYAKIEKHYLAKLPDEDDAIITDILKVAPTLNSLCVEMDNRYKLLKKAGVRNILEYNQKFFNHQLNPQKGHKFLPYIVIIIDEFSDLIMQSGKEVEMPIARLAQKARAVGMHVIIATQRPTTNVITGIIKSNFPSRIGFRVSSGIDSKTILDTTGAQHLIGRGDMLVSNNSDIVRVQCALVETPEVNAICDYIESQPGGQGAYILPEPVDSANGDSAGGGGFSSNDRDPMFEEIARLVVNSNTASTSSLQRRYNIGYNRAGRIMDQLEQAGIVGPAHGGKPRAVLVDPVTLESILESL